MALNSKGERNLPVIELLLILLPKLQFSCIETGDLYACVPIIHPPRPVCFIFEILFIGSVSQRSGQCPGDALSWPGKTGEE